jgi:hypothetical protein
MNVNEAPNPSRPLVAVLCSVPLLGEALAVALDFAEVRTFTSRGDGVAGLLAWVRPHAVVVDSAGDAQEAAQYAAGGNLPVIHIQVHERALRLFRGGEWQDIEDGATPESVRNVVAGALFAPDGASA